MSEELEQETPQGREISMEEYERFRDQHGNATEKVRASVKAVRFDFGRVSTFVRKYSTVGVEFVVRDVIMDDGTASKALLVSDESGVIVGAFEFGRPCPPFCNTEINGLE